MAPESESLVRFAEGVWLSTSPVSFLGLRLTSTMAVLRLSDGGLLVYSPALLDGIGVLRDLEDTLAAAIGRRRMRELHETLKLIIAALEGGGTPQTSEK